MDYLARLFYLFQTEPTSDNPLQTVSYFDVIPTDILPVVIQFLGERPYSRRWSETVKACNALPVLKFDGVLGAAARDKLTTLNESDFDLLKSFQLARLANVMAPRLKTLYLSAMYNWRLRLDQFHALRVLVVFFNDSEKGLEQILATCGNSLRELHLYYPFSKRTSQAIANNCICLEHLDLGFYGYEGNLEHVFAAIGKTLRIISGLLLAKDYVHAMRHCSHLEKLDVSDLGQVKIPNAAALFDALSTLRVLNIRLRKYEEYSVSMDRAKAFLSACPSDLNIHADICVDHSDEFADYLRTIGTRLRSLRLTCQFHPLPKDVIPLLANVGEMRLSHNFIAAEDDYGPAGFVPSLESIFSAPLRNLQHLWIYGFPGARILSAIARSTSSLRVFECDLIAETIFNEVELRPVQGGDISAVLRANTRLRCMALDAYVNNGNSCEEELVNQLVDAIRHLKFGASLGEAQIRLVYQSKGLPPGIRQKIRDACVPLRTKRLNLIIGGERFLPS